MRRMRRRRARAQSAGKAACGATPDSAQWQIVATLAINDAAVTRAVRCKAAFLAATNVLDPQELSEKPSEKSELGV